MRDVYQEYIDTCHDYYDIYPEERMRDVSRYVLCTLTAAVSTLQCCFGEPCGVRSGFYS